MNSLGDETLEHDLTRVIASVLSDREPVSGSGRSIEIKPLLKGKANFGLFRIVVDDQPHLISKITNKKAEFLISKELAKNKHIEKEFSCLFPKIYFTKSVGQGLYAIFMEELVGINLKWKDGTEAALAHAMNKATEALEAIYNRTEFPLRRNTNRYEIFVADVAQKTSAQKDTVDALARILREDGKRIIHEDVFWPNISVTRSSQTEPVIRFIDFGLVSLAPIGADLHHFARASLDDPLRQGFFEALLGRYSQHVRSVREADIRRAAYAHAAFRAYLRSKKCIDASCTELIHRATR